uniref:RWD domain-containing protein n=1 Tax=Populus trichocarpa TaxID=3694 RepID=B9MV83_POPTR
MELEAVLAVYGDDCAILDSFPPHLHLHSKPRTVDISSQQYPSEPLHIDLIESKGLDGERQKQFITSGQHKACELSSCLMLVALCEEVVEKLSVMNHRDGDCPLCLYPLVPDDEQHEALAFMKLMGNCPVDRRVFHAKGYEHVLDSNSSFSIGMPSK